MNAGLDSVQDTQHSMSLTRSRERIHFARNLKYFLFVPSLLLVALFSYYPAVRSIEGSFTSWNGFSAPIFVGFQNFATYLNSPMFLVELRNVAILVCGGVLTSVVFPFIGASLVVSLSGWTQKLAKYLFVVPMVVPQVVLIDIWANMLNPNDGLVDSVIQGVGLNPIQWFSNSHTALLSILLIGFPWISNLSFLIFLAGLQGIPQDVKEAALLDNCVGISRVLRVDFPLIMGQIQFVVVISGIQIAQNFIPILLLTQGGPGNATVVPGLDMYQSAFENSQMGYGMAIGTLLCLGMLVITTIVLRLFRPRT